MVFWGAGVFWGWGGPGRAGSGGILPISRPASRAEAELQVDDPFQLEKRAADELKAKTENNEGAPGKSELPLLLGAFVRVEIEGVELKDVAEIPRLALQENDQVFVVSTDDTLRIEKVDVAWGTEDTVVPIEESESIVPRTGGAVHLERIDGADHVFSGEAARVMAKRVVAWLPEH